MADSKISALASGSPAQAGDEYVVARSGANYKLTLTNIAASMPPIGATTPNSGAFTTLSASNGETISGGNLTFSSTAQRITGDMSNATIGNRLAFQNSVTNGNTVLGLLPNGTATISAVQINNNSDTTAALGFGNLQVSTTEFQIAAAIRNAGTYLPMTFYTGGSERMRLDTSGNVGIGTSSPTDKLHVAGGSGSTIRNTASAGSSWFVGSNVDSYILHNESNTPMVMTTNNTERMRITAGGEVYIAGTADQGAYNLQCNGTGVWGAGAYVNGSDERLKDDITTLDDGLSVVSQLRPVTFKYKPDYSKDQSVQTGFIAQELQAALEGKDYLDGVVQAGPTYLNVAYQSLIPILTKAIQEQQVIIDELKAKVAALEAK